MSWNIAKPGDQINGPVAVTGNLNVDSNTLFVDSANNRVGVLTASPTVPLDVVGDAKVSGNLTVDTNTLVVDAANNRLGIGTVFPGTKVDIIGGVIRINNGSSGSAVNDGILLDNSATTAPNNYLPAINWNTGTFTWATIDGLRAAGGGYGGTIRISTMDSANANTERLRIASDGVCTWSNVGGVAGTAMTLNGTGLGIGTAPASFVRFHSSDSQLNTYNYFQNNQALAVNRSVQIVLANGTTAFGANNRDWRVFNVATSSTASDFVVDYWNGTAIQERLRIDSSGNVGIGTATPLLKFVVSNAGAQGFEINPNSGGGSGSYAGGIDILCFNRTTSAYKPFASFAESFAWLTATTGSPSEKMVLTTAGNLGLGVTPSAWAGYKAFQTGRASFTNDGGPTTFLTHNWYWSGSANTFIANDYATRYLQTQGKHFWSTSTTSGTAGNPVTFTDSMVLDASGNLGLGVTPKAWAAGYSVFEAGGAFGRGGLAVRGLNSSPYAQTWLTMNAYRETDSTNDTAGWKTSAGSTSAAILIGGNDNNVIKFLQSPWTAGGNAITWTPAMTLFSDGNLAIGTASNNGGVCVEDRYILVRSNNAKQFLRLGTDGSNDIYLSGAELLGITGAAGIRFSAGTGLPERLRIKSTGQLNFVGLASDPAGAAAGDVYYNTTTNKLKCYNGTTWNDLF